MLKGSTVDPPPASFVHTGWVRVAAGVMVALIFWWDTSISAGTAIPVLYVVPSVLFIGGAGFREPLVIAALTTVLSLAGYYLSPAPADASVAAWNRVLAVTAIWLCAGLIVFYMRSVERWTRRVAAANQASAESMRHLESLQYALDQSSIIAATDQRGAITYVNDRFCEISQYSRDELLGQDHRLINSRYHPPSFIRDLWVTIANGRIWRGELRNRAKDGSYYWVDTTIVPFVDERGKPWQYLSIRNDITPRKVAEERLRDEAALTQLGRLSAVVAHEVRNPLAALKGSLQVLAGRLPDDLRGKEIIAPMIARIDALNGIVQDILTYSRPQVPKYQRFDLRTLLHEVSNTASAAARGCVIDVQSEAIAVRADPEMTRSVLLNLLLNACAVSTQTPVSVSATVMPPWCEITIADRGPGIPAEVREHLFEPFITTRPGGTGLGLPIAKRLTQAQGGTVTLADRPGGGTEARVRLPLGDVSDVRPAPASG